MDFDINADISRQFTRDGRKVLAIVDSGLDIDNPLAMWVEGENGCYSMTKEGRYLGYADAKADIITKKDAVSDIEFLDKLIAGYGDDEFGLKCKATLESIKENLHRLEGLDK